MIYKNEIPILEFDTDTDAIIIPKRKNFELELPEKCVFAFLGEHIDEYAKAHNAVQVAEFLSVSPLAVFTF